MKILNNLLPIIIVILSCYWAVAPLFHPGFFPIHDDAQIQRVFEMKKALIDGMFPVRWTEDLGFGYGYPIFTFYAPFVYYVGGFFNSIGFDSLIATKIMIGLGIILAGISMYLLTREFWGKWGAIISSMLYVYAPYHALNIYVRGAISEMWAYGLLPFVLWGQYKLYQILANNHDTKKTLRSLWLTISGTALAYAIVTATHNLTAMMLTPFLLAETFLFFFILSKKKYRIRIILFIPFVLGILLSAFYWLPALTEMQFTNVTSIIGGGSDYKDHFVCLSQLWNSPWGYGGSAPGCLYDGLSFRVGKIHLLFAAISLLYVIVIKRKDKKILSVIIFSCIGLLISVFLLLDYSKFLWDAIPQMAYFQFPWRFLVLVSFFLSFLGGAFCMISHKKLQYPLIGIAIIAILFINAKLFVPQKILAFSSDHYTNKLYLNWDTSKISYEYMPKGFLIPHNKSSLPQVKVFSNDPSTKVTDVRVKTQAIHANISSQHSSTITAAIAYFPGWQVLVDNKRVRYKQFDQGLKITVPAGNHLLSIIYRQTTIEVIADSISLTGVLILLIGIIAFGKEKAFFAKTT